MKKINKIYLIPALALCACLAGAPSFASFGSSSSPSLYPHRSSGHGEKREEPCADKLKIVQPNFQKACAVTLKTESMSIEAVRSALTSIQQHKAEQGAKLNAQASAAAVDAAKGSQNAFSNLSSGARRTENAAMQGYAAINSQLMDTEAEILEMHKKTECAANAPRKVCEHDREMLEKVKEHFDSSMSELHGLVSQASASTDSNSSAIAQLNKLQRQTDYSSLSGSQGKRSASGISGMDAAPSPDASGRASSVGGGRDEIVGKEFEGNTLLKRDPTEKEGKSEDVKTAGLLDDIFGKKGGMGSGLLENAKEQLNNRRTRTEYELDRANGNIPENTTFDQYLEQKAKEKVQQGNSKTAFLEPASDQDFRDSLPTPPQARGIQLAAADSGTMSDAGGGYGVPADQQYRQAYDAWEKCDKSWTSLSCSSEKAKLQAALDKLKSSPDASKYMYIDITGRAIAANRANCSNPLLLTKSSEFKEICKNNGY